MPKIKPERRAMGRAAVAGSIVMIFIGIITWFTFNAVNGLPFRPTTMIRAEFGDIHSLAVNDDVREDSVRVGQISALTVQGNKALVTLELDGHPQIYRDAHASIQDVSALAAKFLELDPGHPQAGPLGDNIISADRNQSSDDLYQLLDVFDPTTRTAFTSAIRQFGGGLAGHSDDFHDFLSAAPDLLHNVGTVSEDVSSTRFDLPNLISSGDHLVTHFQGREQQISELIRQTDTTFRAVVTDNGAPLRDTLAKAPGTLRALRPALDDLNPPLATTKVAMVNLRPGGAALGTATPDVRGFLREGVPVVHQVPDFDDGANPSVDDLTHTLRDAHPLSPMVVDAFDYLHTPLGVLAPYGPEIGQWLTRLHSFVSLGPGDGKRYAHADVAPGANDVSGSVLHSGNNQKKDLYPVLHDDYPKPGQAETERQGAPYGIGTIGGTHR